MAAELAVGRLSSQASKQGGANFLNKHNMSSLEVKGKVFAHAGVVHAEMLKGIPRRLKQTSNLYSASAGDELDTHLACIGSGICFQIIDRRIK
jgi:hypothetical protein